MKPYFYTYLLLLFSLGSCNSTRSIIHLPTTTCYSAAPLPPSVAKPVPAVIHKKVRLQEEPQLTAALPVHKELGDDAQQSNPEVSLMYESLRATRTVRPDTTTRLPDKASIDRTRRADTLNTIGNIAGGVLILVGIILVIAASASTSTGILPLFLGVHGALAIIVGIPFLLNRSKNSTRGRNAEERRVARRAAKS